MSDWSAQRFNMSWEMLKHSSTFRAALVGFFDGLKKNKRNYSRYVSFSYWASFATAYTMLSIDTKAFQALYLFLWVKSTCHGVYVGQG